MPPAPGKPELTNLEPIDKLLELELEQKRTAWKQSRERYRTVRILSFAFLFLVIAGALAAFFFILTRLQH